MNARSVPLYRQTFSAIRLSDFPKSIILVANQLTSFAPQVVLMQCQRWHAFGCIGLNNYMHICHIVNYSKFLLVFN